MSITEDEILERLAEAWRDLSSSLEEWPTGLEVGEAFLPTTREIIKDACNPLR